MNKKYIAITFGPISRASEGIRSTKGMWASSYFFSYLAKQIITPFRNRTFVLPLVDDNKLWDTKDGVGRFPDRYIFESQAGDIKLLLAHIPTVLKTIAENIANTLEEKKLSDIELFLKNYLKIYFFESECIPHEVDDTCSSMLDLMEMRDTYNFTETRNYLTELFEHVNLYNSFLIKDAFSDIKRFESLEDIATVDIIDPVYLENRKKVSEIERKIRSSSGDELKALKKEERDCRLELLKKHDTYHNYIGIINSDGDNLSKTTNTLLKAGKSIQVLSRKLADFGEEAVKIAEDYKARIIFLGGDDLLIFAPIRNKEKTIFDFIEKLSQAFNMAMQGLSSPPTISFGLSITYYKFPLREALAQSAEMLAKSKNNGRNALTYLLQKHSGQSSEVSFNKLEEDYKKFLSLLDLYSNTLLDKKAEKNDLKLLSSFTYWLREQQPILKLILETTKDEERQSFVKNYFNNSFNEPIHQEIQPFINQLITYLLEVYTFNASADKTIESLQKILHLIHFLNSKGDER